MARSATKIHRYTISKGRLLVIFQSGSVWYPNKEETSNIIDFNSRIKEIEHKREELNDLLEKKSDG